jgi:Fe-S oxidoreductase
MAAMGIDVHELENNRQYSFCCGGGGGVIEQEGAKKLRYRAQELKLREIDEANSDTFMTSCSGCRLAFDDAGQHFKWDKSPQSLLELVAKNLIEE